MIPLVIGPTVNEGFVLDTGEQALLPLPIALGNCNDLICSLIVMDQDPHRAAKDNRALSVAHRYISAQPGGTQHMMGRKAIYLTQVRLG